MKADETSEQYVERLQAVFRPFLIGWEGTAVPFDPARIEEVVSVGDLFEIRDGLSAAMAISEVDLKKSVSRSSTDSAKSAGAARSAADGPATPGTTNVPTPATSPKSNAPSVMDPGVGATPAATAGTSSSTDAPSTT